MGSSPFVNKFTDTLIGFLSWPLSLSKFSGYFTSELEMMDQQNGIVSLHAATF